MKRIALTLLSLCLILSCVMVPAMATETAWDGSDAGYQGVTSSVESNTTEGDTTTTITKYTDRENTVTYIKKVVTGDSVAWSVSTDNGATYKDARDASTTAAWGNGAIYIIHDAQGLVKLSNSVNGRGTSHGNSKFYVVNDIDMSGVTDFTPIGFRIYTGDITNDDNSALKLSSPTKTAEVEVSTVDNIKTVHRITGGWLINQVADNNGVVTAKVGTAQVYTTVQTVEIDLANNNAETIKDTKTTYDTTYKAAMDQFGFGGMFDGLGHAIKNLDIAVNDSNFYFTYSWGGTVNNTNTVQTDVTKYRCRDALQYTVRKDVVGLFGYSAGTIKNLVMDETCSFTGHATKAGSQTGTGSIAGWASGIITNCKSAADVTGSMPGGICGRDGKFSYVTYAGTVTGANRVGGIVGFCPNLIGYCVNEGIVTGTGALGGLVGTVQGQTITLHHLVNKGQVIKTSNNWYVGSFVGRVRQTAVSDKVTLENCLNMGVAYRTDSRLMASFYWIEGDATATDGRYVKATNNVVDLGLNGMLPVHSQWNEENTSVRLVTAVDSLDYEKVVFSITYGGTTKTIESTTAYTSIQAGDDEIKPADIGTSLSKYLVAATIINIPANVEFTVSVYVTDSEGGYICTDVATVTNVVPAE